MTAWVLDQCCCCCIPVMPFLTEELWDKTAEEGPARDGFLMSTRWPDLPADWIDAGAEAEIGWLVDLVTEIRSIRAEMNVPPGARIPLTLSGASAETLDRLARHNDLILTLGASGQRPGRRRAGWLGALHDRRGDGVHLYRGVHRPRR
jgi:valyl-tRNA synthetase